MCEETMKGVEKGAHNIKLKLQDRAVLLANSQAGEGPARGAGSSRRLIEAGRPDSGRRIVLGVLGQCAQGALPMLMVLLGPQALAPSVSGAVLLGHVFWVAIFAVVGEGWVIHGLTWW